MGGDPLMRGNGGFDDENQLIDELDDDWGDDAF